MATRSRQAEPPGSFWSDRVEWESVTTEDGEPWALTLRGIWVGPGHVTATSAQAASVEKLLSGLF